MKHLIKTSLWLLAFMTAGGMLVSCVEEEQEPDFGETGGSTSAKIDVKMPAPGSQAFYAGGKVLLKGSGFSGSDEVYVQHATYQYDDDTDYEEYVADGPKVRAEVTNYTSAELTFVIPSEVFENEYNNEVLVFIKRKGTEYRLGHMQLGAFPVYLITAGQVLSGDEVTLERENQSIAFTSDTKVYLQNTAYDNDGIRVGIGEKIQAEVISFHASQLCFRVPSNIIGEALIILQYNGVECKLDNVLIVESPVRMDREETIIGEPVILRSYNNSFASTDKVYLQPVVTTDNGGYADKGDRIQAIVTGAFSDELNFTAPFEAIGMNAVIWVHDNLEFRLPNYLTVHIPIALDYDRLNVGSVAYLMTFPEYFAFKSTDEIYLQSVTGNEEKVKVNIVHFDEQRLSFLVPDLFNGISGEAIVIFKRNGKEYELGQRVKIFAK